MIITRQKRESIHQHVNPNRWDAVGCASMIRLQGPGQRTVSTAFGRETLLGISYRAIEGNIVFQRSLPIFLAGFLASATQCSTNIPIVDGEVVGPVVTISDGYVSAFFVPTGVGSGVLFDTGGDETGAAMVAGLAAQGVSPEQVTDVFVSHGHGDHVAGVPLFPGARVWAFEADAALMAAEGPPGTTLTNPLVDGAVVPLKNGLEVEVLAAPGHTPGNAVYLIDGILLMGDTAVARSDGSIEPPPSHFSEDPAQASEALTILANRLAPRAAEVEAMVFGHTGSLEGIDALLEWQ